MSLTVKTFLLVAICVSLSHCSTFDITSVSTCTQQSENGVCTRWEQNGSVIETTGCFPAETEVFVLEDDEKVLKRMDQIQIGDQILAVVNGE